MTTSAREKIERFLSGETFAVAGASSNRAKFGNQVLRAYLEHGKTAYPVNPRESEVEGIAAVPDLASLPAPVHGLSVITPPAVTERLVEDAHAAGIRRIWMQPGAESEVAIRRAEELGIDVIARGPCVLVELGFRGR
jgi:predicted CoA-binding protein